MTDAWSLQRSSTFEILSPRLRLRPMNMDDVHDIWQMRRRGENRKFDKGDIDTTLDKTKSWLGDKVLASYTVLNLSIEFLDPKAYLTEPPEWKGPVPPPPFESIEPSPDTMDTLPKSVIGIIGILNGAEVGYMTHPAYQGRGIASEALKAILEWFWTWWPVAPEGNPETDETAVDSRDLLATSNTTGQTTTSDTTTDTTGDAATSDVKQFKDTRVVNKTPQAWPQPQNGTNYIQADTDPENYASHAVLRKSGFTIWSLTYDDFYSELLGTRGTIMFRLARPGTTLPKSPYETVQVEERERRAREGVKGS